jgi:excinuclease ABC subunit A
MEAGDIPVPGTLPAVIGVHGARHNNLRDLDVDVPLWRTVAVVGVSGSGKTSLAIGTLYAEGMQRFLESLSTYSRRRLTQAQRPDVDRIDHLPAGAGRGEQQQPHGAAAGGLGKSGAVRSAGMTMSRFWILPVGPLGSASTIHT